MHSYQPRQSDVEVILHVLERVPAARDSYQTLASVLFVVDFQVYHAAGHPATSFGPWIKRTEGPWSAALDNTLAEMVRRGDITEPSKEPRDVRVIDGHGPDLPHPAVPRASVGAGARPVASPALATEPGDAAQLQNRVGG